MKKSIAPLFIAAGVITGTALTHAALPPFASHYPAGAEGILGASLPPPGVYFRDYNFFYTSGEYDGVDDFDVFVYANAPRVIWISDFKIFGANYGADVIIPFGYTSMDAGGASFSTFGLADIEVEPLLLSWHFDKFDISAGYAFWAATGEDNDFDPSSQGMGFWSHMLTLGGVYYFDQDKTWALSLLNRYEFAHEYDWAGTDVTPGQVLTMEWGLSKKVTKFIDVGLIGYYQQQVTRTEIQGAGEMDNAYVVGLGPEVLAVCPKLNNLMTSLRYNYELAAENRPEGHRFTLTFTYRF